LRKKKIETKYCPSLLATTLTEAKRQAVFTSAKLMSSLNEQQLQSFCALYEKLTELNASHKDNKLELAGYETAYVYALLHANYAVRQRAQQTLRRICRVSSASSSAKLVLSFLTRSFEQALQLYSKTEETPSAATATTTEAPLAEIWPSGKAMCEAMITFSSVASTFEDSDKETVGTRGLLLLCNLRLAKEHDANLYEKCLTRLLLLPTSQNKRTHTSVTSKKYFY
jgi:hypothetical protein